MKLLVIPDVHLKPWMFQRANELLKSNLDIARVVILGDLVDDFGQKNNLNLYQDTLEAAIRFAQNNPHSLWCYGNHDKSYIWQEFETGYSIHVQSIVPQLLYKLESVVKDNYQYVHRIDNVLFSHGGLCYFFVHYSVPAKDYEDVDKVLKIVNGFGRHEMWDNISPLWYRPQKEIPRLYRPKTYMQVVGHTPVKKVNKKYNVISCDSFSTCTDGTPYGEQKFTVVDTITHEFYTLM